MAKIANALVSPTLKGVALRVRGLVQGVGFRPTVWRIANEIGVTGEVLNDGEGVLIRAWGTEAQLAALETAVRASPPPLARIHAIEPSPLPGSAPAPDRFIIAASERRSVTTAIVSDAATCPECLADVRDPSNRRYRYPFTNCTHCGPRLSIVTAIPYDRATTSMASFPMCEACRAEYENPADRRFHAEPTACPICGPRAWLEGPDGQEIPSPDGKDAVAAAAQRIRRGEIVAIKGIGGFHLACDAANAEAVARLRQRKQRYHKPFALMMRDVAMTAIYARVSDGEERLLRDPAAPVVVIDRRADAPPLAPEVAPGQTTLGVMLPYTPLHHLLMQDLDQPIVLTSGNISDEPQAIANGEARSRLSGIADAVLLHDRDIVNRLDDSVARIVGNRRSTLRRARGYAPEPLPLAKDFRAAPRVLALGAELKSTFCILSEGRAILSQHIGDLEDAATHDDYRRALALYRDLFAFEPEVIAVDLHPDYLSTQWGRSLAKETGAQIVAVQHHHAHVVAVLAEHHVPASEPPVLGIVLDGLGMGLDNGLWGGEIMLAGYGGFTRLASFAPASLIGGNRAMREPWRNAFAHLHQCFGWDQVSRSHPDLDVVCLIAAKQPAVLARMMETGLNAPPASSAGRLLDAAAAIIGIRPERVSYEGQAAIEMEALAAPHMADAADGYPIAIEAGPLIRLTWRPFWEGLLTDAGRGEHPGLMAARVHQGLISALSRLAIRLCRERSPTRAVLSGGVFQNRLLLEGISQALRDAGVDVLLPEGVPANDGGIALGQAAIAAAISHPPL